MDIDLKTSVELRWTHERPYKATLTRGAKGQYRWEIEVRGATSMEVFEEVKVLEHNLRKEYAPIEPTEAPQESQKPKKSAS